MRAVLYDESGGPEVLQFAEVRDPEPAARDVLIRVRACALNHLDVVQRLGYFYMPGFRFPHIAGMDVAGEIVALGSEVNDLAIGDRVVVDPSMAGVPEGSRYEGLGNLYGALGIIGGTLDGGYAELCLAPETHVYLLPDAMPFDVAATFPTCYLTAWHALFEIGRLEAGETLLVHAAGSGVSVAAMNLAKQRGARVLATAGSDEKVARAMQMGAAAAANNRTADVAAWARDQTDGRGVDMVFDHVGSALWAASLYSLRIRGRLVNCGNTSGDEATIPSLGHMYHNGIEIRGSDPYRPEEFAPAWRLFCEAGFDAAIDSVYPLEDAASAQAKMLESAFFGKILLHP